MEKRNTLKAFGSAPVGGAPFGAIMLLMVLACFLVTCEDGYQPNVRSISFYQDEVKKKNLITDDNPLIVTSSTKATTLIIKCDLPSSIRELSIEVSYYKDELDIAETNFATEYDENVIWNPGYIKAEKIDARTPPELYVKAKAGGTPVHPITITVGPGDVPAECPVTGTGGGGTPFVKVTNITGIPTSAVVGTLTLNGTVAPANATNKTIVWSVYNAGTTGASISGNTLSTTATGTVTVTATIANGTAVGTDYTKDFTIEFKWATTVATPTASPVAGQVASGTEITLTSTTSGATIYYTTDSSEPTTSSTVYNSSSKPTITSALTLKAIAVYTNMNDSAVLTAAYTITSNGDATIAISWPTSADNPLISPSSTSVAKGTPVTITATLAGATFEWYVDGTKTAETSSTFTFSSQDTGPHTVNVVATKDGKAYSAQITITVN